MIIKKIFIILFNFIRVCKLKELIEVFVAPLLISFVLYIVFNKGLVNNITFFSDINETVITVTSLLSAFGLAALSILVTSSGNNIEEAKQTFTNRKSLGNKSVSYYKLLVIRGFFSLFIQLITLTLALFLKFIIETNAHTILIYIEVYFLLVALESQYFMVMSMYYLLIEPKQNNS